MNRFAHIALGTPDVLKTANFYKDVFRLEETGRKYQSEAGDNPPDSMVRRLYLSDGHINLTICRVAVMGMYHFGFVVDNVADTLGRAKAAGATQLGPRRPAAAGGFGEVKIQGPEDVIIDLSETGWPGHATGEGKDKLQHFALGTPDVVKTADFYKEVFGLREVYRFAGPRLNDATPPGVVRVLYLSDGYMNFAICRKGSPRGLYHIGFTLEKMDETVARLKAGDASFDRPTWRRPGDKGRYRGNEVKYRGPQGVTIDLSEQGWSH